MSAGIAGLIFGFLFGLFGGVVTAVLLHDEHEEPEDPSVTQKTMKQSQTTAQRCWSRIKSSATLCGSVTTSCQISPTWQTS